MAYLPNLLPFEPFSLSASAGSPGLARPASPRTEGAPRPVEVARTGFSALEWSVIALAERDPLASLAAPGRLSLAMGSLFGGASNPRLADFRLEALRRFAVLAWDRGYALPPSEFAAFRAAGFGSGQTETLLGSIARRRAARRMERAA